MAKKQPGYAEALVELEEILEQLEGDDLDVDQLAALVGRASELLIACRSSITRAQEDVDRIVKELDELEAELDEEDA